MIGDVIYGLILGVKTGSCIFGALAILLYQARLSEIKIDSKESLTYFQFVMLYLPLAALLAWAGIDIENLFDLPKVTIISAFIVLVLFLITCVFTIIRELKRENK